MAETPDNPNVAQGRDGEPSKLSSALHSGLRTSGLTGASPSMLGASLTGGRLLAKNTLWNLFGSGAPMLVAVVCIPILIKGLGKDRFGVLTLAWALIGYASLFDLGLGRALTQIVAKKLGAGEEREIPSLAWTSLLLMLLLGLVGTAFILLVSPWLAGHGLNVPLALRKETVQSFRLLGLSLPFVITTAGLRGLLEAHQRFGLINALRIPMGVFTFAGPVLALPFSKSLVPVIAVLVAGRIIGWGAHLLLCMRVAPELRRSIAWEHSAVSPLMRLGGWMTVSNLVSPLMVTFDRFLISALISMTAVAYYATPYEVVTKLLVIPGALVGVLFPAFSTSFAQDRKRAAILYDRSVKYILMILFPVVLLIVVLAADGLKLWLGPEFAQNSARILQWLAVGVLLNSLAYVPFALVQGAGRPDLTAKLHLIELPCYLLVVWWLIHLRGIEGAAIAWTLRVTTDAIVLFYMARQVLHGTARRIKVVIVATILTVTVLFFTTELTSLPSKALFAGVLVAVFTVYGWFVMLTPKERALVQSRLRPEGAS